MRRRRAGTEIACNLLDASLSSEAAVVAHVAALARQHGLEMGAAPYVLGPTRQQLLAAAAAAAEGW